MNMEIYILSTFLFEGEMLYLFRKYLAENWGLSKEGNNKNRIFFLIGNVVRNSFHRLINQ